MTRALFRGVVALTVGGAALGACTEYGSLASLPTDPGTVAPDTALPTAAILAPPAALEQGDSLRVAVQDDRAVRAVLVFLTDTLGRVAWTSDSLFVSATADTVAVPIRGLSARFPYDQPLDAYVWVQDGAGRARYGGTPNTAALDFTKATTTRLVMAEGRSVRPSGIDSIGGLALDPTSRLAYVTIPRRNMVVGILLDSLRPTAWRIPVGSSPHQIALHPTAWGATPSLAVFNQGGTDVSLVDLGGSAGGIERRRIVLPLTTITVGIDTLRTSSIVPNLLLQCPTDDCATPTLFAAGRDIASDLAVTRTIALTAADPLTGFDIITPAYDARLESDASVNVRAWVTSRETLTDSTLFTRANVSMCGTLAFGTGVVATTEEPGGPIFLGESGQSLGTCRASGGRVVRLDPGPSGAAYTVAARAVVHVDRDPRLSGVTAIGTNADGSRTALVTETAVYITDGALRVLGTLPLAGVRAVAYLQGQRGEGRQFVAAATEDGVTIFETQHFRAIRHFATARPLGDRLYFHAADDDDALELVGLAEDRQSIVVIPTSRLALEIASGQPLPAAGR